MKKLGINFSSIKVDEIPFDSSLLYKEGQYIYNEFNEQLLFKNNEYCLVTNNPNDFLKNPNSKWSMKLFTKDDKNYYIPDITEFHVGFEFEFLKDSNYIKEVFLCNSQFGFTFDDFPELIKLSRVKYLDKEDIESLGWIDRGANRVGVYFYGQYFLFRDPLNEHRIFIQLIPENSSDVKNLFTGIIKNKSELKKIMQQIGILWVI